MWRGQSSALGPQGTRTCDHWWEPETKWHRDWKNHFPKDRQEVIHTAGNGERHIADVKTESGVVLEFQGSHLRRDERESRESFCQNMVWVVDALKRVRDRPEFLKGTSNNTGFRRFLCSAKRAVAAAHAGMSPRSRTVFTPGRRPRGPLHDATQTPP